jgi:hypothetical protein
MTDDAWVTAETIDGPRVAEYIKEEFPHYIKIETVRRRLSYWEQGTPADVDALDRMLLKLGGMLSHVPDEVFTETRKAAPTPKAKKKELERKFCESCGKEIPMRYPNGQRKQPYKWKTVRFCDKTCRSAGAQKIKFGKAAA